MRPTEAGVVSDSIGLETTPGCAQPRQALSATRRSPPCRPAPRTAAKASNRFASVCRGSLFGPLGEPVPMAGHPQPKIIQRLAGRIGGLVPGDFGVSAKLLRVSGDRLAQRASLPPWVWPDRGAPERQPRWGCLCRCCLLVWGSKITSAGNPATNAKPSGGTIRRSTGSFSAREQSRDSAKPGWWQPRAVPRPGARRGGTERACRVARSSDRL